MLVFRQVDGTMPPAPISRLMRNFSPKMRSGGSSDCHRGHSAKVFRGVQRGLGISGVSVFDTRTSCLSGVRVGE